LTSGTWAPPVDVCETEDAIHVRVEVPGLKADDIQIGLTNTQLRIWGEKRKRLPRTRIISHLCSERSYGRFSRIVPLRWTFSVREATATLANGMLLIRLPKAEDRRGAEFRIVVKNVNGE
jgi:HSP20 family protein